MKKFLLLLFVLLTASAVAHEPKKSENVITLTTAVLGGSSHNQLLQPFEISYMRSPNQRFYWGLGLTAALNLGRLAHYDYDGRGPAPYRNSLHQNIYKLSAIVCYDIKLVKCFYLRVGAGVGIGIHEIKDNSDNPKALSGKNKVLPYFDAQINWLFKLKRVDILLSPLIFVPSSKISFSPVKLGGGTDVYPWYMFGPSIGVGVKF